MFMVLSKRFIFYDTYKKGDFLEIMDKAKQEELIPFYCEFNKYYLTFVVVTNQDIRIYNAKDGKLEKIISGIVDEKTKASITAFATDDRQRKFYVGDAAGSIR